MARQPRPSPFLRTWWLDATATGEPAFVLVLENSRLIGGLALQRHRRLGMEVVEMMGQGPLEPDHLDAIAEPGHEATVVDAINAWMRRRGARVLDLDGVEPDGLLVAALPRPFSVVRHHVARAFHMPVDLDGWLGDQPRVVRNQVRPTGRRLDREGITFRRVPVDETDEATAALRRLHVERFEDETAIPAHWTALERAIRAGAPRGEAVHFQLRDGDEVGVTSLHFDLGGRRHYYQSGRRTDDRKWRGAGSVLLWRVMQDATDNGIFELDHLRGDEPYKAQWSNAVRHLVRIRCGIGAGRAALAAMQTWRDRADEGPAEAGEPSPS